MKKISATLLIVFSITLCKAQQNLPPDVLWSKCYGGSQTDKIFSIQPTPDGGYIIAGSTNSSDGDIPGGHTYYDSWAQTFYNSWDAMIIKIDSIGNLEWARNYGGSGTDNAVIAYPTSDGGYIFGGSTGSHDGDVYPIHCDSIFDMGGWGNFDSCSYKSDYWLVKLDNNGSIEWSRQYGGTGNDGLLNLIPTTNGRYYLCGEGDKGTHPNVDENISSFPGLDFCWITMVDSVGNIIWEKSYGDDWQLFNNSVKMTSDSSGLISFNYYGPWLSGTGGDVANSNYQNFSGTVNGYNTWLFKIDTSGNILWSSVLGHGNGTQFFVPQKSGNIFMDIRQSQGCAGNFDNVWYPIANGNGILVDSFTHYCVNYPFAEYANSGIESSDSLIIYTYQDITKIDLDGNLVWRSNYFDSSFYDCNYLNSDGSLMACGLTYSNLATHGMQDAFIVKFNDDIGCHINHSNIYATICFGDSYFFNGHNHTYSGFFSDTINSISGCDSVIHLHLTVSHPHTIINEQICQGDLYIFNGDTLSTSGNYSDTLLSFIGCDSVISLSLSFISNAVSSLSETICSGEVFNFNGGNLNSTGIYIDTLSAFNTCDSIITLHLTVETVNTNIQQTSDTLSVSSIGTIQWFNCNTQQIISGATGNIFIPTVTGNYAAIITEGNCTDTSACINMIVNSINSISESTIQFSLFPNPTNETVTVQFSQQANCKLEISNTLGQIIFSKAINHKSETINLQSLPSGLYFCSVKTEDGKTAQQKLIVQH